jgi:dihydrofolate reductase
MGRLIYTMNVSLDGFVETPDHRLDWTVVDEELHAWFNDRARELAASLYGRRLYDLMAAYWPTAEQDPAATPVEREFARLWAATPRIVFSSTLEAVEHNSRLERSDPVASLPRLKGEFDGDLEVGGPTLASAFIRRGLVDEYGLVVHPVVLGAGTPFFPALERPLRLRLTDSHVFASGVTYLGYAPASRRR